MAETVNVALEDLLALRKWREAHRYINGTPAAADRLIACIPWGPSEEDITAYCEACGVDGSDEGVRRWASRTIRKARERGWDVVPRRIEDQS